jgi:flagellar biosynthesis protein FlhA
MNKRTKTKTSYSTIALAFLLMGVICIMILPVPSWALDIGLAASFSLAILMFTVTLFIQRPLDFSAFPTILLGALILRLSLNIASTKLIIGNGHTGASAAGDVIEGFAMFIMGGNTILGIVVFCVLLLVNFLVINKGATRMAEVGARFALDAMPGKQLAIDSDLASGAITHEQAKERRETEQAETTFFGSLDGASKFVKGDAIAGLLITALNLFVGIAIGVLGQGMSLSEGFATYSILTVGDGLVSQIPAVIISIASALLLARGGATGATDAAVTKQLGKHPAALISVSILLAFFALLPGLPFVPFLLGAIILGFTGMAQLKKQDNEVDSTLTPKPTNHDKPKAPQIIDLLETNEIHIDFANNLIPMALDSQTGLDVRIANIRKHVASEYGVLLPEIHLTDNPTLNDGEYIIKILGVAHGQYSLKPDLYLVLTTNADGINIQGDVITEPVFNAPAIWVDKKKSEEAALNGLTVIRPAEVLATHLLEVIKQNFPKILTLSALQTRLEDMTMIADQRRANANKKLLDSLIPDKVPVELLHATLRSLLAEKISIRNLQLIIEAIAEGRQFTQSWDSIYEHVRSRLGFQIIEKIEDSEKKINVIQLSQDWESIFSTYQIKGESSNRIEIALPPSTLKSLIKNASAQIVMSSAHSDHIAIVTTSKRRRFLQTIFSAKGISNPVLSYDEIDHNVALNLVGVIES